MASPLEMYSKFALAIRLCSVKMVKLVGKYLYTDLYSNFAKPRGHQEPTNYWFSDLKPLTS